MNGEVPKVELLRDLIRPLHEYMTDFGVKRIEIEKVGTSAELNILLDTDTPE